MRTTIAETSLLVLNFSNCFTIPSALIIGPLICTIPTFLPAPFEEMFDGADYGYSESWDNFGWNDDTNWRKAIDEYHKEMFKIVDGYVAANKKAQSFWKTKDKIFKKWRKTDGSKAGD